MSCRIIVADDHPLFREAMVSTVKRILPEACLEQAGTLQDVLRLAGDGDPPDTLILDLRFPGLTCIGRLAELRQQFRRTTLIVVSMVDEPDVIGQVMATGVDGFIGKSVSPEEFGASILAIREGDVLVRYLPSGLLPAPGAASELEQLTHRQQDVLRLIAQGKTNKEIARALDISPFTVRIHVSSLLKTLNVPTRTAAAVKYSGN
ncbi:MULTISPECIES: response regulator transcription factor [unclassified Pseudomonas]|uniref:response regulator transcription factor n=1 Tax=unclassified Pseudomonas TaxID=196821 RepID=UPI00244D09AF|nr:MULTISPECIES: response regulator transcription factor [unclassified Pseudomonas]MDH0301635.1 response regulator transcription factor [Pseudomonas sp. GD04091]MDH1987255.1 response regulator transcription factor [Pseudomonas sp. GD03689]